MTALDVVSSVLMLTGCAFAVLAGVGLLRFPDVFARMHAATKPATLGMVLVGIGAMFRADTWPDVTVLVLVVGLQFLTNPIGAHLVGRAAYHAGGEVHPDTHLDELAEVLAAPEAPRPLRTADDRPAPTGRSWPPWWR